MDLSRYSWRTILSVATIAMLIQQAFTYLCQIAIPILADRLADEFGISRAWLGLYLSIQNVVAIISAVGCGSFILRYGGMRVAQMALVLMGSSLLVIATAQLWLYPLAAILLGAAAVSTPASSHILARVCPPKLAPLIFSIKQTGVPVGSLIGGFLVPFLLGFAFYSQSLDRTIELGPFGAALVTGLIVLSVAVALQPVRNYFDQDKDPTVKIAFSDLRTTLGTVLRTPALRDIAFAAFAFGGLQSLFAGFFILYLIDGLNYDEVSAGSIFAIASITAIAARILWGWVGGRWSRPRWVLGGIGLFGGIASLAITAFTEQTSYGLIMAAAILYNVTSLSWHGVLIAETARLAPEGQVGGVTGGVLSFTSISMMAYPAIYGIILAATGSYKIGFVIAALPAFAACYVFCREPVQGPWFGGLGQALIALLRYRRALLVFTALVIFTIILIAFL